MRSRSALAGVVQCLCLLGKAAVLQGFLPAPSVGSARSAAVLRHASSLARASEHASSRSGSRRRRIGATLSRRAPPALSMSSSSSPGGGGSSGVGAAIAKSWVALLLCVASVFGPDVLMQQGLPISPRPPQALALSEEQVSPTSAGCYGRSLRGLAAWGMSFVSRVLSYRNAGCAHAYLHRFDALRSRATTAFLFYLRQYIRRHRCRRRCGLLMPEGICTLHAIWVDTDACANHATIKHSSLSPVVGEIASLANIFLLPFVFVFRLLRVRRNSLLPETARTS